MQFVHCLIYNLFRISLIGRIKNPIKECGYESRAAPNEFYCLTHYNIKPTFKFRQKQSGKRTTANIRFPMERISYFFISFALSRHLIVTARGVLCQVHNHLVCLANKQDRDCYARTERAIKVRNERNARFKTEVLR